ncbi:MAG TPA: transcriptional regulator GcvA [Usitatibacter sp.]|nr:transcriptional regulator GcvA [Usitatibacter sp.]
MRRRLPSLNALRAFEASARHESFTAAALELFVTQGAVSQQVKGLEDELGLRLFSRDGRKLRLTEAGRSYLEVVRDAFDRLSAGTERLLQRQSTGVLNVSTSPNFATKWLVHRLGRFSEVHPEVELRISASMHHVDFAREDIDIAIRHGDGTWPGLHVAKLCEEEIFPVCAPSLARGRRALKAPEDLAHHRLLHVNDATHWSRWLEHFRVKGVDGTRGTVLSQASMAIDAAIQGQGVAMARTALAAWDILGGRLVRPFHQAMAAPFAMWIVCPKATAELPKIAMFRQWLLAEARADSEALRRSRTRKPR